MGRKRPKMRNEDRLTWMEPTIRGCSVLNLTAGSRGCEGNIRTSWKAPEKSAEIT